MLTTVALVLGLIGAGKDNDPDVGKAFRVPYQLTATNHFLVRARINGKGPFNFLVDTGAAAVFVSTDAAKKAGLKVDPDEFWTTVEKLDLEGGAALRSVKVRVEDPYQLVGMNALGLPGASIDGLLGFTALARFKIELDPTDDRMTWTRLAFEPLDPIVPKRPPGAKPPGEMQAMNALGAVAKVAAALVGKQPEDELLPRGFLGIELDGLRVAHVLPGSAAAQARIVVDDRLSKVNGRKVDTAKDVRAAVAQTRPGDVVTLVLLRNNETITRAVAAGEGF